MIRLPPSNLAKVKELQISLCGCKPETLVALRADDGREK